MPIFDQDGHPTYSRRVGALPALQRAAVEVYLQGQVTSDGRIRRLKGEQPAWSDVLDALIVADLLCARLAGTSGFPLAAKVVEKVAGGDVGERALDERAEAIGHWLTPVRVLEVMHECHRILDAEATLRNLEARSHDD